MLLVCLDLEGVLIPETWVGVAERTGIDALHRTTRDEPDYDKLMRYRLNILEQNSLGIREIQETIKSLDPLPGAVEFLEELKTWAQIIILSDTFYPFGMPFMEKLGWPTLFCHDLEIGDKGEILDYKLRQEDPKRRAVEAFQKLNFSVLASGDSYNDTSMLSEADAGILFRPPENVVREFPEYPVVQNHADLQAELKKAAGHLASPRGE